MEVFQDGEGSISSTAAGNVLPQLVCVVRVFRAVAVRRVHSGNHICLLTSVRFRDLVTRFFAKCSFLHRYVQVNSSTRTLLPFLRATRCFHTRGLVYHVFLPMLGKATRQEEGRGCDFYPRRLHRIIVGVPHFLRVTRGGSGEAASLLRRCEEGGQDDEHVWSSAGGDLGEDVLRRALRRYRIEVNDV